MSRRLAPRALRTALAAALLLAFVPAAAASADDGVDQVVDLTFPVDDPDGLTSYTDDYLSQRSRGDHGATDIGGPRAYGLPVHAAVGGRVTWITGLDGPVPSYGWMISIAGTDGREYNYIHLGDQNGPASSAYAPGIRRGSIVERGQHIGYLGHSGNASASWPHLHFEIEDDAVTDRQGSNRINPYHSLVDAERRGDLPGTRPRTAGSGFADVPGGHTHAAGIAFVDTEAITSGCTTTRYCPDRDVTRGQMATFLHRAFQLPQGGDPGFRDVPADHPHAAGIAAVAAAGLAQGNGGLFAPDAPVRRDQMATFLANGLDLPASDRTFRDVDPDSTHASAIGAVVDAGIAQGYADDTYRPGVAVSRAQMATFLMRAHALR